MSKDSIQSMHSDVLDANPEGLEDKQRLVDEIKQRGNLAFKAKRLQEAATLYSKAIDVLPSHTIYSNRAMVRTEMKEYDGALADADACIALDATFAKGHYRKAVAMEKKKKYGPSYDAYKEAVALTPKGKAKDKLQQSADKMYQKACKVMRDGNGPAPAPAPSSKVDKDRFKKGGEAGGFGDGAAGSATDALNNAAPKSKSSGSSSSVVIDDGDELATNSGAMRGYKTVVDENGVERKTSFFHTELTGEAKALLAKNAGPKKLDAAAVKELEKEEAATQASGSAWNTAKTFEEKDMTTIAKKLMTDTIEAVSAPFEADATATLKLRKAKSVKGEASCPVIRGTKRYLFDFNVTVEWVVEFPASGEDGSRKLKGECSCVDCATDCEGVYECEAKITTKGTSSFSAGEMAAAKRQAVGALEAALKQFTSTYNQL